MVSTPAFHARVHARVQTKMLLPHPLVKLNIVGSLRDREVACSASDLKGVNFESCVWRAVSSHSSHHPQEVLLARFILYVHKKWPTARFISFFLARDTPLVTVSCISAHDALSNPRDGQTAGQTNQHGQKHNLPDRDNNPSQK